MRSRERIQSRHSFWRGITHSECWKTSRHTPDWGKVEWLQLQEEEMGHQENASILEVWSCWNRISSKRRDEARELGKEQIFKVLYVRLRIIGVWILLIGKKELRKGFKQGSVTGLL